MQKDLKQISDYWEEMYSSHIKEYRPFHISAEFIKFASFFAPGNSYFYIVNLHNFSLEYISDSVKNFIGKEPENIQLNDLLQSVLPAELELIGLKSRMINDFYTSFLKKEEVLNYKNMFSYRMKDATGEVKTMLYQAFPLSVLENGRPEHVFCIQTDVSHLKMAATNEVSFLHMGGGKSYYNAQIATGKFVPENCSSAEHQLSKLLTERELEIVAAFSRGLNAEQIAKELNLSPHTIKTHRRNILNKSGCTNTTELVAKCVINGIISPGPF